VVFIVDHHKARGIVSGRFGGYLPGSDGVQPEFQIIGTQIIAIVIEIDHDGQLIEGKQVVGFLIQVFLQIDDVVALEVGAGAFAEENIPTTIKNHDIPESVFSKVFDKEIADRLFRRLQLPEGVLQSAIVQSKIFTEGFAALGPHIDHLLGAADGVAQLIGFGINADEIYVSVVNPAFDENLVGFGLVNQ